uniref:(northern house mosquito) hypothetical protein n=1 Tax=Culex pipiens TaxID=7175 RepID=A0A8D8BJ59_CULPI
MSAPCAWPDLKRWRAGKSTRCCCTECAKRVSNGTNAVTNARITRTSGPSRSRWEKRLSRKSRMLRKKRWKTLPHRVVKRSEKVPSFHVEVHRSCFVTDAAISRTKSSTWPDISKSGPTRE